MAAADCFALGAALSFLQRDVPVLRRRMAIALFVNILTRSDGCAHLPAVDVGDNSPDEE